MWLILIITLMLCIVNTLVKKASVAVSDVRLKQLADDGNKKAKRLYNLLEANPSGAMDGLDFCSVLYLGVFSVFSVCLICKPLINVIASLKIADAGSFIAYITAIVIGALITGFLYNIFVIMIPDRVASKHSEKFSLALSAYTVFVTVITKPVLAISRVLAKLVSRIFGVSDDDIGEEVTEEEIRMMVDIGSESGAIDDDEKQMIHNIFEMDDKPVEEIMTHRTEACILWIEDSVEEWKKFIDETNHTRYPVCGESIDDVIGIVTSRDFYRFLLGGGGDVRSLLRDVFFIPDTIKADELFSKMQSENEHMGVVMDEYGGFQGLVTQEDLIEEIVGELYSEYDEPEVEESDILQMDENTWQISGSTEIEDVEKALEIEIEEGDYNTFAGLILSKLQTIPADGEMFEIETANMKIRVTSVVDHRIESAIVSIIRQTDEDNNGEIEEK